MNVDTPKEITDLVKNFCSEVCPSNAPIWVDVIPQQGAEQDDCFFNIPKLIEKQGGSIQFGWQIWECENYFIEAEFHAVWKSDVGEFVDITPKDRPTEKILFVPDESKKYEGKDVDNIRKNLSSNKLVDYILALAHERFKMISSGRIGSSVRVNIDQKKYSDIEMNKSMLVHMVDNDMTRNSLCPCGSEDRFKHCHEKIIKKLLK
ncbi:TPA: SEC-C domain-containing protein [Vibrio parahaemolyticus]|uniref:SEC-C domain-containing protein n=2 Tax=Vibrio parahaemolyticus TaxID=670 RepID=UPI0011226409|nr:SEC-C domain-containing protein [Vibrio parahaemolyticus]ELA9595967.1 SEC-C domain-containing protein [Vibrio parahaemolyticus]MDF4381692.1 SEC-C domain-containing protein [Vibrio parahaemolyticus]MDF4390959.1 SEC-C domain-containing protein [Vibrio parahaemolyticus]TOJ61756.1 hypothetical protein CGI35_15240 [Vibrio parahaemolyticus]TOK12852.1 hypothetical protein CGI28_17215 [Vibrio parahaemolyticus]